jgi:HAD superfamily hydrolase (TIGR01509 family)
MRYRAVLWDVGGTLVQHGIPTVESIRGRLDRASIAHRLLADEHILSTLNDFLKNERTWRTLEDEHRAREVWVATMFEGQGFSDAQLRAAALALVDYYDVHAPVDGIHELIDELHERGVRQAIVSNWPPSLPDFLQHHGFANRFACVCYSAQDGIHKPDERIFHRAMNALGVTPAETIMIGDNIEWDIEPARRMGMAAIHFDPRKMRGQREADDVSMLRQMLFELPNRQ